MKSRPLHGLAEEAVGSGIYLGAGLGGRAFTGPERSVLVLGPSRSGKTSSLVTPYILLWSGAVVTTSTKPDVLRATAPSRGERGWPLLYDPSGSVEPPRGVERVGWSPVNAAVEWDGALAVGSAMIGAARGHGRDIGSSGDHWSERAASLLAPLLHAAAIEAMPMSSVLSWVDRHDASAALSVLEKEIGGSAPATDVLAGIVATDAREQSGIWSTASGALSAYRSTSALASTLPPYLDADAFCRGANTLYICASGRQQELFAPLVVGLLAELRDAAYARSASGPVAPVLFALDEVANISPLPDLPAMVSEGAGQGLITLACLQDLSQARRRWGREADAFPSLFGTTVVFGGIADLPTLRAVSALAGDEEVVQRSFGTSQVARSKQQSSVSVSTTLRSRLAVDVIARGAAGLALAIDAQNRVGWVELTPAHRHAPFRDAIGHRGVGERVVEGAERAR